MISPATRELLLEFEVGGGESYYNARLKHPTWPGVQSGVTIGVGWDCGYNSASDIRSTWAPLGADARRLEAVAGVKGFAAKAMAEARRDIVVPWALALDVFETSTIPRFSALVRATYPGANLLHPDAFGALLSLTFNRGSKLTGETRREMKALGPLVKKRDYPGMAAQVRAMKRLWPDVRGLLRRREAEAALLERCEGKVAFRG